MIVSKITKVFFLFLFFCFRICFSQNIEFTKDNFPTEKESLKKAIATIKEGDKFYEDALPFIEDAIKGNYDLYSMASAKLANALYYYTLANTFNPNNAELNFKIGICNVYAANKVNALAFFQKAYKLDPKVSDAIHYYLGRGYHLTMEWEKAIEEYKLFQKQISLQEHPERHNDVTKKIKECENGREIVKRPVRVFIDNLGKEINSPQSEYSPLISSDQTTIFFTSRRAGSLGGIVEQSSGQYFEDIYMATYENEKWNMAKNIGEPVNTEGHDANLGLSGDGQRLFIYKDDKGDGNIYESKLQGNTWQKPEKLNKNINSSAHESSVSLSYDSKTIYFVSDRAGGLGYRDIYVSKLEKKGNWGLAQNIGPIINTPYGEEGVFIHPDGKTIYFSSQGHNTMGGYDIFKSVFVNGKWTEPQNLGYPINTPDDDVFFVLAGNGKHGYYSSIKEEGLGEKDLYKITFLGPEKPVVLSNEDNLLASVTEPIQEKPIAAAIEIKNAQVTLLKGIVSDDKTKKPIEATIEIIDNQLNEIVASFTSNSASGKYLVSLPSGKNYGIAVKAENYLFHSENFDIPSNALYQELHKDIALKNIDIGSKIVLNNIFYDVGKATLRKESTAELDRLQAMLNELSSLVIEISGHTDNTGNSDLNQKLSEARAKSVVDYLIAHGIKQERLQYKGYGFSQPIASNTTEQGRQQNRRTEFKVISK